MFQLFVRMISIHGALRNDWNMGAGRIVKVSLQAVTLADEIRRMKKGQNLEGCLTYVSVWHATDNPLRQ